MWARHWSPALFGHPPSTLHHHHEPVAPPDHLPSAIAPAASALMSSVVPAADGTRVYNSLTSGFAAEVDPASRSLPAGSAKPLVSPLSSQAWGGGAAAGEGAARQPMSQTEAGFLEVAASSMAKPRLAYALANGQQLSSETLAEAAVRAGGEGRATRHHAPADGSWQYNGGGGAATTVGSVQQLKHVEGDAGGSCPSEDVDTSNISKDAAPSMHHTAANNASDPHIVPSAHHSFITERNHARDAAHSVHQSQMQPRTMDSSKPSVEEHHNTGSAVRGQQHSMPSSHSPQRGISHHSHEGRLLSGGMDWQSAPPSAADHSDSQPPAAAAAAVAPAAATAVQQSLSQLANVQQGHLFDGGTMSHLADVQRHVATGAMAASTLDSAALPLTSTLAQRAASAIMSAMQSCGQDHLPESPGAGSLQVINFTLLCDILAECRLSYHVYRKISAAVTSPIARDHFLGKAQPCNSNPWICLNLRLNNLVTLWVVAGVCAGVEGGAAARGDG